MPRIEAPLTRPKLFRDHEKITNLFCEGRLSLLRHEGSVATGALGPPLRCHGGADESQHCDLSPAQHEVVEVHVDRALEQQRWQKTPAGSVRS
jgi:hypothetical protein